MLLKPVLSFALFMFLLPLPAIAQNWACPGKTGCTTIGAACPDGTVFAGCPPTSYKPIYTTRCDMGQTWDGSACTGGRTTLPYNNGNASGYTDVNAAENMVNGAGNTTALVAADSNSGVGGTQPHQAAAYCDGLNANGYTDWYLPAAYEMSTINIHEAAVGNFAGTGYWTSTQPIDNTGGVIQYGQIPALGYDPKQNGQYVRCTRKD